MIREFSFFWVKKKKNLHFGVKDVFWKEHILPRTAGSLWANIQSPLSPQIPKDVQHKHLLKGNPHSQPIWDRQPTSCWSYIWETGWVNTRGPQIKKQAHPEDGGKKNVGTLWYVQKRRTVLPDLERKRIIEQDKCLATTCSSHFYKYTESELTMT